MADKKAMLEHTESHARARRIRPLQAGKVITMRLDVALAYMKLHNLEVNRWLGDGSILEVRKAKSEGDSDDATD